MLSVESGGVGGWRGSREDLGAAVGEFASREVPVDNDIAAILRRMQPRSQRYRGRLQLDLQSVLVAEGDEVRKPVDGHQVTSDWVVNLRDIRRVSAERMSVAVTGRARSLHKG